jgi:hypothetical protein
VTLPPCQRGPKRPLCRAFTAHRPVS